MKISLALKEAPELGSNGSFSWWGPVYFYEYHGIQGKQDYWRNLNYYYHHT